MKRTKEENYQQNMPSFLLFSLEYRTEVVLLYVAAETNCGCVNFSYINKSSTLRPALQPRKQPYPPGNS